MPFIMGDVNFIPPEYRHYWEMICACPVPDDEVQASLSGKVSGVESEIGEVGYLTIHESFVEEGRTQRRPGVHVEMIGLQMKEGGSEEPGYWGGEGFATDPVYGAAVILSGGLYMASSLAGSIQVFERRVLPAGVAPRHLCSTRAVQHQTPYLSRCRRAVQHQTPYLSRRRRAVQHQTPPLA